MLVKRVITAAIAIPLVSTLIYRGSEVTFFFVVFITAGLSLHEFFTLSLSPDRRFLKGLSLFLGLLTLVAIDRFHCYFTGDCVPEMYFFTSLTWALITVTTFIISIRQIIAYPHIGILRNHLMLVLFGICYISLFLSFLLLLRYQPGGVAWIFFILLVLWLGDTGAYSIGTLIGHRKLSPSISPNKTVEGAAGGLILSLLTGYAYSTVFLPELGGIHSFFLSLSIAIAGQAGDLAESAFKRLRGVKDSGNLFPGHGGILDRIDSLLYAAPVAYYYKVLLLH